MIHHENHRIAVRHDFFIDRFDAPEKKPESRAENKNDKLINKTAPAFANHFTEAECFDITVHKKAAVGSGSWQ